MDTLDAIVVLSGGIKQTAGRWRSTDLTEEDDTLGAPGGALRVVAAAILSNRYPQARVIATGGKGYDVPQDAPEDRPLLCEILRNELLDVGVPEDRLDVESASNTTYDQLQQIEIMQRERGWNTVAIISNRWHLPRIETMVATKFPNLIQHVHLVAAEDILIADNHTKWQSYLTKAYASEWLARRIQKEEQGITQIKDSTYQYK